MSWQGYVDTNLVGTGKISQAAIIGLKGGVWATSPDFNVSGSVQPRMHTASPSLAANGVNGCQIASGLCSEQGEGL